MSKLDTYEREILTAFEKGKLKSVATTSELERFKAAARATAIKDRRVNIRLSSTNLGDIQTKALQEGVPYRRVNIAAREYRRAAGSRVIAANGAGLPIRLRKLQSWETGVELDAFTHDDIGANRMIAASRICGYASRSPRISDPASVTRRHQ